MHGIILQTYYLIRCFLFLGGHGSIDDPDGTVIYEQTYRTIQKPEFEAISLDIIAARLPPSDQLLDLIIRNAVCALQLSHREGFEVKVTEALYAGKVEKETTTCHVMSKS